MRDTLSLDTLRQRPVEWRRRGLTPPSELNAIVAARLDGPGSTFVPAEPSYADFFVIA